MKTNKMKIKTKLVKISSSYYALIPAIVRNTLGLIEGDSMGVEINKIHELVIVTVKCPCGFVFSEQRSDVYDCPICGKEILSDGEEM